MSRQSTRSRRFALALAVVVLVALAPVAPASRAASSSPPPERPATGEAPRGTWLPASPTTVATVSVRNIAMNGNALDPNTQIVAATSNGVYHSTNGGSNWEEWGDGLKSRNISSVVWQQTAPNVGPFYVLANGVVYSRQVGELKWREANPIEPAVSGFIQNLVVGKDGTLFATENSSSVATAGVRRVFKRAKDSSAWSDFSAGLPVSPRYVTIGEIVASRDNVFISIGAAIYISALTAPSWSAISFYPPTQIDVTAMAVDEAGDLYAARYAYGSTESGVYQTTNCATPIVATSLTGPYLCTNKLGELTTGQPPTPLYVASLAVSPDYTIFAGAYNGLYRSDPTTSTRTWYRAVASEGGVNAITFSPDAYKSAAAGNPIVDSGITFLSTSSGAMRIDLATGEAQTFNQGFNDLRIKLIQPAGNDTLFASTDNVLHRSTDGGASWTSRTAPSYFPVISLAPSPTYASDGKLLLGGADPYRYYGYTLRYSENRFRSWSTRPISTEADFLVASPRDSSSFTLFAASNTDVFTITDNSPWYFRNAITRSIDEGRSWTSVTAGLADRQLHAFAGAPSANASPQWLAGTDNGIYSLGANDVWAPLGGDIGDVRSIVYSRDYTSGGAIFALSSTGMYSYTATSASWSRVAASGGISGSLPLGDVRVMALSPSFATDHTLFVGTASNGVLMSSDAGANWVAINRGLPNLDILSLAISPKYAEDQTIFVGTNGSGIFKYRLPPPAPEWLVLLYMGGDDDNPQGIGGPMRELRERLDGIRNENMRLVALFDGNAPNDSQVSVLDPGGTRLEPATDLPDILRQPEFDSGNVGTLRAFVRWALDTYPGSRHTMLSIIDHGGGWAPDFTAGQKRSAKVAFLSGGWRGMSIDALSDTSLSTKNTREALAGEHFDILFFDACFMGMLESLYEVRNNADYLIAGENILWANFLYDRYLSPEVLHRGITAPEFARQIVKDYNTRPKQSNPAEREPLPLQPFAIAAIDARKLESVAQALNKLAQSINAELNAPTVDAAARRQAMLAAIKAAYDGVQTFDYDSSMSIDPTDGYADLANFAQRLSANLRDGNLKTQADALEQAAIAAVLQPNNKNPGDVVLDDGKKGTWKFDNANGISIYLPIGEEDCRPTDLEHKAADDPGLRCKSTGDKGAERQLAYYQQQNQLALTDEHPEWSKLLGALQPGTLQPGDALQVRLRNLADRPFRSPMPRAGEWKVFLPLITNPVPPPPPPGINIVVKAIEVRPANPRAGEPAEVLVTIQNIGARDISQPFWVDLYVNPSEPPQPNRLWSDLCQFGAAWLVYSMGAGEERVLSTRAANDPRNSGEFSNFERFPANRTYQLYALADSYADGQAQGVLTEDREDDNLRGPVPVSVQRAARIVPPAPVRVVDERRRSVAP